MNLKEASVIQVHAEEVGLGAKVDKERGEDYAVSFYLGLNHLATHMEVRTAYPYLLGVEHGKKVASLPLVAMRGKR